MMRTLLLILTLLTLLLSAGCADGENSTAPSSQTESIQTSSTEEVMTLPQELIGVWVSADEGERDMIETITFYEDGSMTVELKYQGSDYGTLYGSCTPEGHRIICSITDGASPYTVEYEYRIDGRELILTDDDGPAHYLRTS